MAKAFRVAPLPVAPPSDEIHLTLSIDEARTIQSLVGSVSATGEGHHIFNDCSSIYNELALVEIYSWPGAFRILNVESNYKRKNV